MEHQSTDVCLLLPIALWRNLPFTKDCREILKSKVKLASVTWLYYSLWYVVVFHRTHKGVRGVQKQHFSNEVSQ